MFPKNSRPGLSRLLLSTSSAVVLSFATGLALAQELPSGGLVTSGTASISQSGSGLTVTQSSNTAILNWSSFSVGSGASAHFANGSGATLNRVTGNLPSAIDGSLTATGSLYLINPAGIAVGTGGMVRTGGSFVASTLNAGDADFLQGGTLTLKGASTAGVVNLGTITSDTGDVVLTARRVENAGSIAAAEGSIGLLAGYEVELREAALADGKFAIKIGGSDTAVINTGSLAAAEVELRANGGHVQALAGNTGGIVKATGVRSGGGRIFLTAGSSGKVTATQRVVARKAAPVPLQRPDFAGGSVSISGGSISLGGAIDVGGMGGNGGSIIAVAKDALSLSSAATLDASGANGGLILLGGDYQGGGNAATRYATGPIGTTANTSIAQGTIIAANGATGAGGNVVVWGDKHTSFAGIISATGITEGGDAEVSGKATLAFTGTADLRSTRGTFGTLLLDPYDVTISNAAQTTGAGFSANGDNSVINVTTLQNALATANVVVTTNAGGGAQAGDITVASPLTWSSGSTLTLDASSAISINAPITISGAGGLTLNYNASTNLNIPQGGRINFGAVDNSGRFVINGTPYTLIYTMGQLDAIDGIDSRFAGGGVAIPGYLSRYFALATNLDASGITYAMSVVTVLGIPFEQFHGNGNTISNLRIEAGAGSNYIGLFSKNSRWIDNIGLVGGSVSGQRFVGALIGENDGFVTGTFSTASVSATGFAHKLGGLIGSNTGIIQQSYSTGAVTAASGGEYIGGLAGEGGIIAASYATGPVTVGMAGRYIGGLAGSANTINDSWSSAAVAVSGFSRRIGGLVGENLTTGDGGAIIGNGINRSYATGAVTVSDGGDEIGGLVGYGDGSVHNSFATGTVRAGANSRFIGGLVGSWYGGGLRNYSLGAVIAGADSSMIGGLAGLFAGRALQQSYSAGAVVAGANSAFIGGFFGLKSGNGITDFYNAWDVETSGQSTSAGGAVGVTTAELESEGTVGWGDPQWAYGVGIYPYMRSFFPSGVQAVSGYATKADGSAMSTNAGGPVTVSIVSGGTLVGTTTAGANGYYYYHAAPGRLANASGLATFTQNDAAGGAQASVAYRGGAPTAVSSNMNLTGGWQNADAGALPTLSALSAGYAATIGSTAPSGFNLNNRRVAAAGNFTIDQALDPSGGVRVQTGGNLTIAATGRLRGLNPVLIVGGNFINNRGAAALTATVGGRWIVYAANPNGHVFGGLDSANTAVWGTAAGAAVAAAGNRYVFANQQTVTVTSIDGAKKYGTDGTAYVGGLYTFSGLDAGRAGAYRAATAGDVLSGTPSITSIGSAALASRLGGPYVITAAAGSLVASSGYSLAFASTGRLTINRGDVTVTAHGLSRSYGDANPLLTYTVTGLANGHTLTGSLATAADIASFVGSYAITQGSLAAPVDYSITFAGANLTIVPRLVTVTADAQSRIYGNANPMLTYGQTGLLGNDVLTGNLATAASSSSGVGSYAIARGTLAASANYAISYVGANLVITPRTMTVTADAQSRVYGDANPGLTYTQSGLLAGDALSGSLVTVGTTAGVGKHAITLGSLGNANYAVTYTGAELSITPRALTITANAQSRSYGDANPALTYSIGGRGLANTDAISLSTAATTGSGVGNYAITLGGLTNAGNYALDYRGADLTVGARTLTIAANAQSRVYGDANPVLTFSIGGQGLANSDTFDLNTAATTGSGVGRYAITLGTLANASNYAVSYQGADLTIGQRSLTVTADAVSRVYGDANPALTYSTTGLVNGDTLLGGLATSATTASGIGSYAINPGTLANANYAVTYQGANLTISRRTLTVTADAMSRSYGDANSALTYSLGGQGLANDDTLSLSTTANAASGVGSYAITLGMLTNAGNYDLSFQGNSLDVVARAIAVRANDQRKVSVQGDPELSWALSGGSLASFDTAASVFSGGLVRAPGEAIGNYRIEQGTLVANGNYALTFQSGTLTIAPARITIAAAFERGPEQEHRGRVPSPVSQLDLCPVGLVPEICPNASVPPSAALPPL